MGVSSYPPVATATTSGLVPTPPNNTTTFLRGDATFAAPASSASTTIFVSTCFETAGRFGSSVVGGGTVTYGTGGASLDTSATITSGERVLWTISSYMQNGSPTFGVLFTPTLFGTDFTTFCGIGNSPSTGAAIDYTFSGTNGSAGFKMTRAASGTVNLYGTNSNGTTETATASLTTVAQSDEIDGFLKINGTTSVDYYYRKNGGTQSTKATNSTNLPAANTNSASFQITNSGVATDSTMVVRGAQYTR